MDVYYGHNHTMLWAMLCHGATNYVLCTFNGAIKFKLKSVLGRSVPSIRMERLKYLTNSKIKLFHDNKGENLEKKRKFCYQE
jgi:hypothetical protein